MDTGSALWPTTASGSLYQLPARVYYGYFDVAADNIISRKATDTGDNRKSEDTDRLWQVDDYIEMKVKEAARTF